jgi:LPXTG-site transpeptidase (sortase) family protein
MANILQFFLNLDPLWLVALLIGVVVVILLRARQVWADRQSFGYNIYTAESLSKRLLRWAMIGAFLLIIISGFYIWRLSTTPNIANVPTPTAEPTAPSLEGMELVIPRLDVRTPIIEAPIVENDWDISLLTSEVAHLAGTAYPGQDGNTVLVGHITIPDAGWGPFQELETLEIGDEVFVRRGLTELRYEVFDIQKVPPTSVDIAYPTDDTRLTLITCTTWDYALETYAERFAVMARLVDAP